jgi:hypothetical protein
MAEHAVVRNIEVIGEASKHLSARFKERHKDIPFAVCPKGAGLNFGIGKSRSLVTIILFSFAALAQRISSEKPLRFEAATSKTSCFDDDKNSTIPKGRFSSTRNRNQVFL